MTLPMVLPLKLRQAGRATWRPSRNVSGSSADPLSSPLDTRFATFCGLKAHIGGHPEAARQSVTKSRGPADLAPAMVIGPLLHRIWTAREGPAPHVGKVFVTMVRRIIVSLFAGWAGWLTFVATAGSEPAYPPGSRIGLEVPGDLKPSTRFPGFEDTDRKVAIAILDLPASAYLELETAVFTKLPQDLQQAKRESFPFESGIGFLITGIVQKDGTTLHRWSFLAQAVGSTVRNLTVLINVEVPENALSVYSDAVVRKALASVTFRPAPIKELLGALPFHFGDLAGFEVIQVMPTGTVVLADNVDEKATSRPVMIVSVGRGGPADPNDRGRFARDLVATAPVRELSIKSAEPMRINNAAGYEIRAEGKDPAGQPLSLVQWVRFGAGGYLRIVGAGPSGEWNQMFGRFRAVRDGIDLR